MAKTKLKKCKEKANAAFSKYIRNLYAVDEMVNCYTCTTVKPVKSMQAGHGIPSRSNAVLYMEEVVRPQCYACNMLAGGRYKVFTRKLIDEMGEEKYNQLVIQSNQTVKYSAEDFLDIRDKYIEKLKNL